MSHLGDWLWLVNFPLPNHSANLDELEFELLFYYVPSRWVSLVKWLLHENGKICSALQVEWEWNSRKFQWKIFFLPTFFFENFRTQQHRKLSIAEISETMEEEWKRDFIVNISTARKTFPSQFSLKSKLFTKFSISHLNVFTKLFMVTLAKKYKIHVKNESTLSFSVP